MTNHDNWLGYLVAVFADETLNQSKECCPGCHSNKNSALLHSHHHSGLLEKLHQFHTVVKEIMLGKITELVQDYTLKFPDSQMYDDVGKGVLRVMGKDFLQQSDPAFIYYSHYLTPKVDEVIDNIPQLHIKPMNWKRVATVINKKSTVRRKKRVKKDN